MLTNGGLPLTVVDGDNRVAGLVTLELVGGLQGAGGQISASETEDSR